MDWRTIGQGLRIGGHRGAAGEAPENTLAGFEAALRDGADYLECDVHLTTDGVAVVIHDHELERTSNGQGPVAGMTARELADLDAGAWFDPRFAGQRIPRLAELLAWLEARPQIGATIEAKGLGTAAVVAARIAASPARERLSVCSSDPDKLRAAASVAPDVARLLIADRDAPDADPIALARSALATGINLPWDRCDRALVDRLHQANLLVAGGTADTPEAIRTCLELGIDAVDSNSPSITVPARTAWLRGNG
ncbi:MAG: glycerophosphodiester phosphodiesterase [Candidatus Limnocylindrales bacterium]